jgi:hypothetical protein
MIAILDYATLILLCLLVLSGSSIVDVLYKAGYVKSRFFILNPLPCIEYSKKMYNEGDINMRFWVKLFFICCVLIIPLSLLELTLHILDFK